MAYYLPSRFQYSDTSAPDSPVSPRPHIHNFIPMFKKSFHLPITPSCWGVKAFPGSWDKFFRKSGRPTSDAEETPDRTDPCLLIDLMLGLRGLETNSANEYVGVKTVNTNFMFGTIAGYVPSCRCSFNEFGPSADGLFALRFFLPSEVFDFLFLEIYRVRTPNSTIPMVTVTAAAACNTNEN